MPRSRALDELVADSDPPLAQCRDRVAVHRRLGDRRRSRTAPERLVVRGIPRVVDVRDEAAVVLRPQHVRELGHRTVGVTQLGPDDRVEAGVPQPTERIRHRIGNGVALGLPMGLHDGSHLLDQYRHRAMPVCAIVSFRLGLSDGVSIIAAGWQRALTDLGFDVTTVAGEGPVDRLLPGLAIGATEPPADDELRGGVRRCRRRGRREPVHDPVEPTGGATRWAECSQDARQSCTITTRRGSCRNMRTSPSFHSMIRRGATSSSTTRRVDEFAAARPRRNAHLQRLRHRPAARRPRRPSAEWSTSHRTNVCSSIRCGPSLARTCPRR